MDTLYPVNAVSGAPTYSGRMLRQVGAVALAGATAARPLGARSGVRPGTPASTINASSTVWVVGPFAGTIDAQAAAEAGPYDFAFDAQVSGAMLAANASYARTDILYVQVDDPSEGDGSTVPAVTRKYLAGTAGVGAPAPTLPPRSLRLGYINMPVVGGGEPSLTWDAQYAVGAGGTIPVWGAAARNAVNTGAGGATPPVYRMDMGWTEQYLKDGTVAAPGWYDTAVRNFYKRGTDVNPIPTAAADVPGSSLTFALESPRFCTFNFTARMQLNVSMLTTLSLNIDGADVQDVTYGRQETGGSPSYPVAGVHGVLLPAGTHTVKLRASATLPGASVAIAPAWTMVGTVPILGTYN